MDSSKRHFDFNVFGFHFFKEAANVISPYPVWVLIIDNCWLYTNKNLLKLFFMVKDNYKSDRFLVG